MDMKRIIKEYYNQVHADWFNNLDENGPIPWKIEIYQSSHNLNRLVSIQKIESIIKNFPKQKVQD